MHYTHNLYLKEANINRIRISHTLVDEVLKSDYNHNESVAEDDGFVENNLLNELDDALINEADADPLLASDHMLPILDSIGDDNDSLFDELERILVPEGPGLFDPIDTVLYRSAQCARPLA